MRLSRMCLTTNQTFVVGMWNETGAEIIFHHRIIAQHLPLPVRMATRQFSVKRAGRARKSPAPQQARLPHLGENRILEYPQQPPRA